MKQAVLYAVIAFLTSASVVTGVMVKLRQPIADATPDRTESLPDSKADSASGGAAGPAGDSLVVEPAPADSVVAPAPHRPGEVAETLPAQNGSPGPAPRRPVVPAVDPEAKAAAYKQVARVLSAMKPPQAAEVLSRLSDDEVEGILRAVGPRQAADFLTNLPTERAGVLSRRLLVPIDPKETR